MTYPGAISSFTTKSDGAGNTILAAHMNAVQTDIVAIETELGTDPAGSATDVKTRLAVSLADDGDLRLTGSSTLTISGGAVTATNNYHKIDTEAAASTDTLDTINGGADGYVLVLVPANSSHVVTISHNTGNIYCVGGRSVVMSSDNDMVLLVYSSAASKWRCMYGAAFANPMTAVGDIIVGDAAGVPSKLAKGTAAQVLTMNSGGTTPEWAAPVASGYNHAHFHNLAALLDPGALEPFQIDAFTYVIGSSETKYITASWYTYIGASGRMEVRDPRTPLAMRGQTLKGAGSGASAIILDPTLPTYTDAYTTYYDRLAYLDSHTPLYIPVSGGTALPFLPGAYGAILTRVVNYDYYWIAGGAQGKYYNFANEESDASTQRNDNALTLAVNKYVINEILPSGGGGGGILYHLLPSTWSGIAADTTTYLFRDDFMLASLDTTTKWTRTESSAGNVEIDTQYQWCKVKNTSTNNWGTDGAISQTSITRASGKVFMCDVYLGRSGTHGLIVGFHDGAGLSYTDFAHGVLFNGDGTFKVFENGNDRGVVGSGHAVGSTYRVRITLGTNNAAYAIQGGTNYARWASWTDITPGTTSSSTTPLYAGLVSGWTGNAYVSDVKIY